MKQNVFKIKKTLKSKDQHVQQLKRMLVESQNQSSPSKPHNSTGLKLLQKMKLSKKQKGQHQLGQSIEINQEIHEKDKKFLVSFPSKETINELNIEAIQKWFTKVFNQLFSISYNYLAKNVCRTKQLKHFISENAIKHFLRLSEETPLSEIQLQKIGHHIQKRIIPYALKKYPNNNIKEKNTLYDTFEKEVVTQRYENDIFYNNKKFKVLYRQNGNYNDLIMNVINHIASKMEAKSFIESKSDHKQESIENTIKYFQNYIANIVYNQQNGTKSKDRQLDMEFINQMPDHVQRFSQQSIINRYFQSDNPFVLTILINWSHQLWNKFQNPQYYRSNQNKFLNHRGKIIYLKDNYATALSVYLQEEAKLIEKYLEIIKRKFYEYQSKIVKNIFQIDHDSHIDDDEKYIGKYTCDIVASLSQLYSLYLNRLIHGLCDVSEKLEKQYGQKGGWKDGPLNLLSLQVIDLFKCKIKGDKSQILAIHEQLRKISHEKPDQLKIINIQQKYQEGKSCLVQQIIFKRSFQSEIILQIKSQRSQLQKNDQIMYEILSEIQKSIFGPLDYFSRQWIYSDQRWQQFIKINKANPPKMLKSQQINQLDLFYNVKPGDNYLMDYNLPFECSYCKVYHFNNNYIVSNQKHKENPLFKCFRCRLQQMNNKKIRSILLPEQDNIALANYQLTKVNRMPKKGIAIPIHGKQARYEHFTIFKVNNNSYYLGKQKGIIYEVVKNTPQDIEKYLKNHYVFSLPDKFQFDDDQLITENQVKADVYLPNYLLWAYQDNLYSISLINQNLTQNQIKLLVQRTGYEKQRECIRKIQLMCNKIKNSSIIFDLYPKITHLDLQSNSIIEIAKRNISSLKYISLQDNDLFKIPEDIKKLINLKELDLSNNHIKKLQNICQLQHLNKLNVSFNAIKELPSDIHKLSNLIQFNLQSNKGLIIPKRTLGKLVSLVTLRMNNCGLDHFGDYIFNLTKLQLLDLSSNCITTIPERIEALTNLQYLYVNNNQITNLPLSLSKLQKIIILKLSYNKIRQVNIKLSLLRQLQFLQLDHNRIQNVNESICDLVNLKHLLLDNNKLKQIPVNIGRCNNLQLIRLEQNLLQTIPFTLKKCKAITYSPQKTLFNISCNRLKLIPNVIAEIPYLKTLQLCYNHIIEIPSFISKLTSLQNISLNNNQIKQLPQQLGQLTSLKEINIDNNKIQILNDCIFQKLNCLEMLTAQNNQIRIVSASIFKNVSYVSLSGNKIQKLNVQNIKEQFQVKVLNLNNNNIETIENVLQKFNKLKVLKLKRNKGSKLSQQTSLYMQKIKIQLQTQTI